MTTMTSRAFNQHTVRTTREAEKLPVIITDRGKPSHVLMTYEQYELMTKTSRSIWDALAVPG